METFVNYFRNWWLYLDALALVATFILFLIRPFRERALSFIRKRIFDSFGSVCSSFRFLFQPIRWETKHFLGMSSSNGNVTIHSFQVQGKVRTWPPIKHVKSYIKILKTGEILPVIVNDAGCRFDSSEIQTVMGGTTIAIHAPFPDGRGSNNLGYEEFIARYGHFDFVVELDGRIFTRTFREEKIRSLVNGWLKSIRRPSNVSVIRK